MVKRFSIMFGIERGRVYDAVSILAIFVDLLGILLMLGGISGRVIYWGGELEEWAKEKKHEEDVAASQRACIVQ